MDCHREVPRKQRRRCPLTAPKRSRSSKDFDTALSSHRAPAPAAKAAMLDIASCRLRCPRRRALSRGRQSTRSPLFDAAMSRTVVHYTAKHRALGEYDVARAKARGNGLAGPLRPRSDATKNAFHAGLHREYHRRQRRRREQRVDKQIFHVLIFTAPAWPGHYRHARCLPVARWATR